MSDSDHLTKKDPPPAAQRALTEAAKRRAAQEALEKTLEAKRRNERGGPRHIEPTRYGDWERKGITYDF